MRWGQGEGGNGDMANRLWKPRMKTLVLPLTGFDAISKPYFCLHNMDTNIYPLGEDLNKVVFKDTLQIAGVCMPVLWL